MPLDPQLAHDSSTPDGLVKAVVQDVINTFKGDASLQGDRNKIAAMMDEKIWPYVDFQRTMHVCMRGIWLDMTPEQRRQVAEQFKKLLTAKYAEELAQMRNHRIEYKPLRAAPDAIHLMVESRVVYRDGPPLPLAYSLTKTANGWRVYDLKMDTDSVVETYRQAFSDQIRDHGIDWLIETLRKKNQSAS